MRRIKKKQWCNAPKSSDDLIAHFKDKVFKRYGFYPSDYDCFEMKRMILDGEAEAIPHNKQHQLYKVYYIDLEIYVIFNLRFKELVTALKPEWGKRYDEENQSLLQE